MTDEVIFEKKLRDIGGVTGISLPPELLAFLEANKGDILLMTSRRGKSGKGVCIWKKEINVKDGEGEISE